MKLLIDSIEGGTYLATVEAQNQRQLIKDHNNSAKVFHCLNEIKDYFQDEHFDQVWLKQNTPYDEMCGLQVENENLEILINWH